MFDNGHLNASPLISLSLAAFHFSSSLRSQSRPRTEEPLPEVTLILSLLSAAAKVSLRYALTGPVGSTVGQIGKIKGCRVVGVAGGG